MRKNKEQKDNIQKPKEITISKETAKRNIAEWLYVNDGAMENKQAWRIGLIEVIAFNINHLK